MKAKILLQKRRQNITPMKNTCMALIALSVSGSFIGMEHNSFGDDAPPAQGSSLDVSTPPPPPSETPAIPTEIPKAAPAPGAFAPAEAFPPAAIPGAPSSSSGKTKTPEAEDYSSTPFTEYGEFNEANEEEADAQFFQFGRFFGISLGLGTEAVDGNRGLLWQGGFPLIDFKVHYWFDFNLALTLGFYTASHYFSAPTTGQVNVSMFRAGIDLKYYFSVKNLSSALSFASPYLIGGVGAYSKSEYSPLTGGTPTSLGSVGVAAGAGLEFTLSPKKTYLEIEGKINVVPFYDSSSTAYLVSRNIPNLSGNFWTISSNLLLTW